MDRKDIFCIVELLRIHFKCVKCLDPASEHINLFHLIDVFISYQKPCVQMQEVNRTPLSDLV